MTGLAAQRFLPADVDLASSIDRFEHAAQAFFNNLADIGWLAISLALVLWVAQLVARSHGWANALRASYPDTKVDERFITASFLAGAGINGIMPAHIGDAVKIVLAKRSIRGSSYPAIASSFAVLTPFDVVFGICVLGYAFTQGLLPRPPELPQIPAFEISFWARNPEVLLFTITVIGIGVVIAVATLADNVEAFWRRIKQGVTILTDPPRYLREVAAWQLVGWLCRFTSFWLFLDAFHIGGSVGNVLLVMSVQAISTTLPFTPGGAGAQQALLVATLSGSAAAVLSFSVGQQVAVVVFVALVGFAALAIVFRITDWRKLLRESRLAQETERTRASES
jgi:glycosyltransferase 2 family protein